jgi:hypothetical protein
MGNKQETRKKKKKKKVYIKSIRGQRNKETNKQTLMMTNAREKDGWGIIVKR